jgi:hypothetical protein
MKVLYWILQCTWGGIQTFAGLILFLKHRTCHHQWFQGAVHTEWEDRSGISLGMFIFTPKIKEKEDQRLLVHEYGHTFQSAILGPFYLLLIGLPSIIWCRAKWFQQLRKKRGISYYSFYTEKWADWLGECSARQNTNEDRRKL